MVYYYNCHNSGHYPSPCPESETSSVYWAHQKTETRVQSPKVGWMMNEKELERKRSWRNRGTVQAFSWIHGGAPRNCSVTIADFASWDSNRGPFIYDSRALPIWQRTWCAVYQYITLLNINQENNLRPHPLCASSDTEMGRGGGITEVPECNPWTWGYKLPAGCKLHP
jgi:hypothetical protein